MSNAGSDQREQPLHVWLPTTERFLKKGGEIGKVTVELRSGESQESLLRRFRNQVTEGGVLSEVRKRRWFVSKGEQRRMAKRKGIRRAKKRRRQSFRQE